MSQSTQPPPLHATLHTTTPLTLPAPLPPLPFLVPSSPTFLPQLYTGPQFALRGSCVSFPLELCFLSCTVTAVHLSVPHFFCDTHTFLFPTFPAIPTPFCSPPFPTFPVIPSFPRRNHMRWSAPLHYVGTVGDHPPDNCLFPGTDGWDGKLRGNVLDAIQNVTSILADFAASMSASTRGTFADEQASEVLKFLIHFVGDMHQPLHLTGRDRGVNGVKVSFDGRNMNLHSVWAAAQVAGSPRPTRGSHAPPRHPTLVHSSCSRPHGPTQPEAQAHNRTKPNR
ncbi:phospholipase C/P1 nuclease domain-containing protein [Lactarius akahatsu]|uniref:Phospholipase C/P1 nuclease domain-containing protein n=1 Tax=Lactarius akahatsu TaxID=416441 RepID=A0AAD4LJ52_9AGAM|nr:phospholipase C/P1 nuclease domain-containing protein [Lactarius akahatsu]